MSKPRADGRARGRTVGIVRRAAPPLCARAARATVTHHMIHALLKEGTRAQHARAEASLPVLDPALSLADYARVVEALHGFHVPLERRLAAVPWARLGLDWNA